MLIDIWKVQLIEQCDFMNIKPSMQACFFSKIKIKKNVLLTLQTWLFY